MATVVVPVGHPLKNHSRATLSRAIDVAEERDADLIVLHVNLPQDSRSVSREPLKMAVEREFGILSRARYVVRSGLLVEENILEEIVALGADVVVIGEKQAGRWRQIISRLVDDPDVATYLESELDCEVLTVSID